MDVFDVTFGQWLHIPEDDDGQHTTGAVTTFADDPLGRPNNVEDYGRYYPAELMLQSRLVEDGAASRPMQELFSYTDPTTFPSESTLFWPCDVPVMEPQQLPSTADLGIFGLWPQASYPFNGEITAAKHTSRANIEMPVPSPAGSPSLQGSPLASSPAYTAYDFHLSLPPTPASSTSVSTPGSSGVSTSTGLERTSVATSLPAKKRLRSVPYARPTASAQQSIQGSRMDPTHSAAQAREQIREGVQRFVTDNPNVIEPCIGDPAAIAIVGSNPRLGTPGKSLYTVFFFSSRSGCKVRYNCHGCAHTDTRVSRALRHQRQDHFGHFPFPCQGGAGHPACGQWFSSDEYATDHVAKAVLPIFSCPECPKEFSNVGNLGRHRKKTHGA